MNKKFSNLFLKMFIPYVSILLLTFVVASIAYVTAFKVIEDNAVEMQESYLEQSKSGIDQRFRESIDASYQLRGYSSLNVFKEKDYETVFNDFHSVVKLNDSLRDTWFQSESIKGYFVFFKDSGVVANDVETYFYDSFGKEALWVEGISKQEFWNQMFSQYYFGEVLYAKNMAMYEDEFFGIPIVTTLGYGYDSPNAVIFMIINGDVIKESMTVFAEKFHGNFFIIDEDNHIVMALNNDYGITELGDIDKNMLQMNAVVVESESEVFDYKYILVQPKEAVFGEINKLRKGAIILVAIMMILGFLGSIIWARKNSAPVASLMSNNELLTQKVNKHLPYLRTTFLERWLKGTYSNNEEIASITRLLKTDYSGDLFCVMVIDYDEHSCLFEESGSSELKALEMKRVQVKEAILEEMFDPVYIHDIDFDKLAVIFINTNDHEEEFEARIREKAELCGQLLSIDNDWDVHIGIGNIYNDMLDVPISLSNALDALAVYASDDHTNIFWFKDVRENSESYYYPFELENRLFNCVRSGDIEVVTTIFRDLLNKNMIDRNLSDQLMSAFIYDLYGTLNRIKEKAIGIDSQVSEFATEAVHKMYECSDIEKIQLFKKTLIKISMFYAEEKSKKQDMVIHRIIDYIYKNLDNQDFGLQVVADEFSISYKYASQLFKEHTKTNFSNYLQKIRMEEAQRLLISTNMPVNEIVTACGYNSSNTFGKAFKRFHGITASVYRERNKLVSE